VAFRAGDDLSMCNTSVRRAVILGIGLLVAAACGGNNDTTAPAATSTVPTSTSSTTQPATTTSPRVTTTTTAPTPVPAQVTGVSAGKSGGSGEVQVDWNAVSGATGYRVYRSNTLGGPFLDVADIDVMTGKVRVAERVANIYSDNQTFYPLVSATPVPSTPAHEFHYVEYPTWDRAYFQVAAYNATGEGPPSVTDCGAPITNPQC
jgi:hypothetical protein